MGYKEEVRSGRMTAVEALEKFLSEGDENAPNSKTAKWLKRRSSKTEAKKARGKSPRRGKNKEVVSEEDSKDVSESVDDTAITETS